MNEEPKRGLVWVSLSANPAPRKIRRVHLSPQAREVGGFSQALWPHLERQLRRHDRPGFFLPLEDVLWPAALIRAIVELRPEVVHYQFHPDFWPGRGFLRGDFTTIHRALRNRLPGVRQLVTPHSPPQKRWWGTDRFDDLEIWVRPTVLPRSVAGQGVPGVRGTVSRSGAASTENQGKRGAFDGVHWGIIAEELASLYFPC